MAFTPRVTIITNSAQASNSAAIFAYLDPDTGGTSSLSVPLNSTGIGNPTHFAGYSQLLEEAYTVLTGTNQALKNYLDTQPDKFFSDGSSVPRPTLGQINSFKQVAEIEDLESLVGFDQFISNTGLTRIAEEF